jgi:hypothetical protein
MHRKYSKDDFAAVSVSLDDPSDKEAKANVVKFLQDKKATFTNLILDEQPEVWQEKLKIDGPPCVFVFNREGQQAKKFDSEFTYADVEKVVAELMKKK